MRVCFCCCGNHCTMANKTGFRRGSINFSKGGGVEEENFERKMFFDTRINACTHKNRQTCNYFSLLPFQEDYLYYYSLLFLKFEREVATPVTPSRSAKGFKNLLSTVHLIRLRLCEKRSLFVCIITTYSQQFVYFIVFLLPYF